MTKLIAGGAVFALVIPSVALAAGPLKFSPSSVAPGGVLTISGKGPAKCTKGKTVSFLSTVFKGGNPSKFKVAKLTTKAKQGGKFSLRTTIPANRKAGRYIIRANCTNDFSNTLLTVT